MSPVLSPEFRSDDNDLVDRPQFAWRPDDPFRCASTAVLGGGIGERRWVLNATVSTGFDAPDPAAHLRRRAADHGLIGFGVGLLTALDVRRVVWRGDAGAETLATVGITWPTWAADAEGTPNPWEPGTINLIGWVPAALSDAALINAVATMTEAKAQALRELGVPGTGTASDAVVVCCPLHDLAHPHVEPFGGPRSTWGARLARAAHQAVLAGATLPEHPPLGPSSSPMV